MEWLNEAFQRLLSERGFCLQKKRRDKQISYHGRLELSRGKEVDFALLIPRSQERANVQIVFDGLARLSGDAERQSCLELINDLNVTEGVYYYFGLKTNGEVFARYILPISSNEVEILLDLIQVGSQLVLRFQEEFGELVGED